MGNGSRRLISPGLMDMTAQGRESVGLGNCGACDAERLLDEAFHELDPQARELVLRRAPLGFKAFKIRQSVDDAGHNRLEQCLLPGKVSINRRLACRRHLRDLIDTRALIASCEEYLLSRIENSRLDVARQIFRRSADGCRLRSFQI